MTLRSALKLLFSAFVAVLLLSMIFGGLLGQPIGLTYVETGSMSPALEPGDGFIAIPTAIAGPVSQGDVVVFDAVNINDGELVTHRVLRETNQGYITKGDANPFSDQDGAEPPVQRGQIKAKALTIGGTIIGIPHLGTAVTTIGGLVTGLQRQLSIVLGTRTLLGTQGMAYLLMGFGIVTYLFASLSEQMGERKRARKTKRNTGILTPSTVVVTMMVLLILLLTLNVALPAGSHQFQFVSSSSDAPGSSVIKRGTTENVTFNLPSNGVMPVVTILEPTSQGVTLNKSVVYVSGGSVESVTVRLQAPAETGSYSRTIHEHRYLAFLPLPVILWLYNIHPWLPIVAVNALMGTLFATVATLLIGIDPIRIGRRQENVPLRVRIRRWLD
jgi:signal peptidase